MSWKKLVLTSSSLFSARSRLIFSSSRCSSAVSSSSSLDCQNYSLEGATVTDLSSSLLSSSPSSSESASISLVSSNTRRLLASGSSSSPSPFSSCLFDVFVADSGSSATGNGCPLTLAKCAASAWSNSARKSRGWLSASPPCPGFL